MPDSPDPAAETDLVPDVSFAVQPPDYGTGDGVLGVARKRAADPAFADLELLGGGFAVAPSSAPASADTVSGSAQPFAPAAAPASGRPAAVEPDPSVAADRGADEAPVSGEAVADPPSSASPAREPSPDPVPAERAPDSSAVAPAASAPPVVSSPPPAAPAPVRPVPAVKSPRRPAARSRAAGLDEDLQRAIGLTRDGQSIDWELEGELLAELEAAGLNLPDVRLRYEQLSAEERRSYKLFQVQQAFRLVIDKVEDLVRRASTRAQYSFTEHTKYTDTLLERFAALQLLIEAAQARSVALRDDLDRRATDLEARLGVVNRRTTELDAAVERAHERASALHQEVVATGEELGLTAGELRRASFVGAVGGALFGSFVASVVLTGLFLVFR